MTATAPASTAPETNAPPAAQTPQARAAETKRKNAEAKAATDNLSKDSQPAPSNAALVAGPGIGAGAPAAAPPKHPHPDMAAEPAKAPRVMRLQIPRFQLAEYSKRSFFATPEAGVTLADMLQPEFWAHVAQNITRGDFIEAILEDCSAFYEFFVMEVGKTWAVVVPIREVDLRAASALAAHYKNKSASTAAQFKVEFKGLHLKYCVIRLSDQSIIKQEFADQSGAESYLRDYLRTINK